MISSRNFGVAAMAVMMVLLSSCFLEREPGRNRTLLKAGAAVPEAMDGWVAVSPAAPKAITHQELGITYRVLATHQLVLANMEGYKALSPTLFEKYTKINVAPPTAPACQMWNMKINKKVSKEMDGWVGLPLWHPEIQKEGKYGLAVLSEDQVIPREMNGWIAVDTGTLVKLAGANARQGRTLSDEKPIKTQPMKSRPVNNELLKK